MESNLPKANILVVDDEQDMRWLLSHILTSEGFGVCQAEDGQHAVTAVGQHPPDIVLLDIKMPRMDGMQALEKIKEINYAIPVIMLTAHGDIPSTVQAMRLGAYDFLTKPFDNEQIIFTISRALDHISLRREVQSLREQVKDKSSLFSLMGNSHQIQQISYQIEQVARTNFTVIIEGETGTGKELVAHFIHKGSPRKDSPFIPVDCSAIPDTLIESELFGYEKGAFTGAVGSKPGYFELAKGGTLLLDELANIPGNTQKKLLRVLQERQFFHLGGNKPIEVDVRVIAATNVPLEDEVRQDRLRRDLYHRLNEFTIYLPPLRERREDIVFLASKFLDETSVELGKRLRGFSPAAINFLVNHEWRGNVRELRNTIRRATLLSPDIIEPHHLIQAPPPAHPPNPVVSPPLTITSLHDIGQQAMEEAEKQAVRQALEQCQDNKLQAAKLLKTDYKTLFRKLKKYNIGKS